MPFLTTFTISEIFFFFVAIDLTFQEQLVTITNCSLY